MAKKIPERTCVICSSKMPKKELMRIVKTSEGMLVFDKTGKLSGRGAYICRQNNCHQKLIANKKLAKALKMDLSQDMVENLILEIKQYENLDN